MAAPAVLKYPGVKYLWFLKITKREKKKNQGGRDGVRVEHGIYRTEKLQVVRIWSKIQTNHINNTHSIYRKTHACFWNAFKVISSEQSSQQTMHTHGPPALRLAPQPTTQPRQHGGGGWASAPIGHGKGQQRHPTHSAHPILLASSPEMLFCSGR